MQTECSKREVVFQGLGRRDVTARACPASPLAQVPHIDPGYDVHPFPRSVVRRNALTLPKSCRVNNLSR